MRIVVRLIGVLAVLVGISLAVAAAASPAQSAVASSRLRSSDPKTRKRGLTYVRDERAARCADDVMALLQRETDSNLAELAAYALLRTREVRGVAVLQQQADARPDSDLKARMIYYAARLSNGDYRLLDWLQRGAASGEPWRATGSCIGLLQLGRVEGGASLLTLRERLPEPARNYALEEFHRVVGPMSQAVGQPIDWPAQVTPEARQKLWAQIAEFWPRFATTPLLADALMRLERTDVDWHEVDRVMHARERVSQWLQ